MSNELMSLEDKARLELTLRTRETIIKELVVGGKIPADPNDRSFLIQALDGTDRTILARAKIKSDDSNAKSNAASANMVAEMLRRVNSNNVNFVPRVGIPALPAMDIELVEGETHIGVQTFELNDIMAPKP